MCNNIKRTLGIPDSLIAKTEVAAAADYDTRMNRAFLLEYFADYKWADNRTTQEHETWELILEYENINM
jgi:hypothetical protein